MHAESQQNKNEKVRPYDLFMLGLCLFVLGLLIAETFFDLSPESVAILEYVDTGACLIFLADFLRCLVRAPKKLQYLKWGWIDLLSSIPSLDVARWGRFARVFRILRLFRGVRSSKMLIEYLHRRRAASAFSVVSLTSVILMVFSSVAILRFETGQDANIRTPEDAVWWSFVTITTVGYGDHFPVSTEGRVLAGILMLAGVGLFGTLTGLFASWFLAPGEQEQDDELESIRRELHEIRAPLERRDL